MIDGAANPTSLSDKVGIVISALGMEENMGVEVEIAAPSLTIQKLFPLPVYFSPS